MRRRCTCGAHGRHADEPRDTGDLAFEFSRAEQTVSEAELSAYINGRTDVLASLADAPGNQPDVMGWIDPAAIAPPALLREIQEIAPDHHYRQHGQPVGGILGGAWFPLCRVSAQCRRTHPVLSMVGLLPIAVAGSDLNTMLDGAAAMRNTCLSTEWAANQAVRYAALRNMLLSRGYGIEILSYSEPAFNYFEKWWIQLFAESEGKDHQGIFPSSCSFSQELHSMGQYIQQGPWQMFETFLEVERPLGSHVLQLEPGDDDEINCVAGKDFDGLNRAAFGAALVAHHEGGVPCLVLRVPALNAYTLGQLFYCVEYACFVSSMLLGVNPFDQPGVEAYETNMFAAWGKN